MLLKVGLATSCFPCLLYVVGVTRRFCVKFKLLQWKALLRLQRAGGLQTDIILCAAPAAGPALLNGQAVRREDSRGSLFMDSGAADSMEVRRFHINPLIQTTEWDEKLKCCSWNPSQSSSRTTLRQLEHILPDESTDRLPDVDNPPTSHAMSHFFMIKKKKKSNYILHFAPKIKRFHHFF